MMGHDRSNERYMMGLLICNTILFLSRHIMHYILRGSFLPIGFSLFTSSLSYCVCIIMILSIIQDLVSRKNYASKIARKREKKNEITLENTLLLRNHFVFHLYINA
jgi:hypothetical protein